MIESKKRHAETSAGEEPPKKREPSKAKSAAGKFNTKAKSPTGKFNPKAKNAFAGKFNPKAKNAFAGKFDPKAKNAFAAKKGKDEPNNDEPKDWRKFKQDKKELKLKRKKNKSTYEISAEAKVIYEKLKCRRTDNKAQLVDKLFALLDSNEDTISKLIMAHDTARVIQCMLKFASPPIREKLSEKLLALAVNMSISKYAHFCVLRMFKYGSPKIKSKLIDSFYGNIVKLASHNISSKILDHAYLTVANDEQKSKMRQEFYGDLYKKSKDASVKKLSDTYDNMPGMKASILSSVKSNLEHVANKKLVDNSLVHAVILEYLRVCDEEKIEETVSTFGPLIPMMLSTKEGSQAAIICFYKAASKHRRAIIKSIKEHLLKICTHEHGHIFIIALLNTLDDTKATKKAIYDTIEPELQTLAASIWGRRVLQWLISPGDTNCFHPGFIANIEEGLAYGKKDKELRRKEIFEQIESSIVDNMVAHSSFWLSDKHIALVTADFLRKVSSENFSKVSKALAAIVVDRNWTVVVVEDSTEKKVKKPVGTEKIVVAELDKLKQQKLKKKSANSDEANDDNANVAADETEEGGKRVPGIEEVGLHVVLKKILKNDKERIAQNTITFGAELLAQMTDETLTFWISINRGCFILLNIIENSGDENKDTLKQLVNSHKATLQKETCNGAQLLKKKLSI